MRALQLGSPHRACSRFRRRSVPAGVAPRRERWRRVVAVHQRVASVVGFENDPLVTIPQAPEAPVPVLELLPERRDHGSAEGLRWRRRR